MSSSGSNDSPGLPECLGKMNLATTAQHYGRRSVVCEDLDVTTSPACSTGITETGLPEVADTMSDAFSFLSLEGSMHENHDTGATVQLPSRSCLFAVLDGHGTCGAQVSGFSLRYASCSLE